MFWSIKIPSKPIVSDPSKASYDMPSNLPTWAPPGTKSWDEQEAERLRAQKPGEEYRQDSTNMSDFLRAQAMGEKSFAREQAQQDVGTAKAGLQSQLRSGQWTPGAQISMGQAEGAASQNIRAGGEIAAKAEQQSAMQQYLGALSGEKALDSAALQSIEDLTSKYKLMGLTDQQARLQAQMAYEQDKLKRAQLETGVYQQQSANANKWLGTVFGVMGTAAGAAIAGSDVNAKQNIASESSVPASDSNSISDFFGSMGKQLAQDYIMSMFKPGAYQFRQDSGAGASDVNAKRNIAPEGVQTVQPAQTTPGLANADISLAAPRAPLNASWNQETSTESEEKGGKDKSAKVAGTLGSILSKIGSGGGDASYESSLQNTMRTAQQVSDTAAKEKTRIESNIKEMLDHLAPYSYEYKDPARFGEGRHVGVMAQDMEQSQLGGQLVGSTPDGIKTIDYSPTKFNPLALAALADINKRVDRLERRRK